MDDTTVQIENVKKGSLFALASIPVGIISAVALWKFGFIASISSLAVASSATLLYRKGSGSNPRVGVAPLIVIIVVGIVLSFYAVYLSDVIDAYSYYAESTESELISKSEFIKINLFNAEAMKGYSSEALMFVAFAGFGTFRHFKYLLNNRGTKSETN